jgi:hypothetical protein
VSRRLPGRLGEEDVMSDTVHYELDVLASAPTEINLIARSLKHVSAKLIQSVTESSGKTVSEIAEALHDIVWFEVVCNLGFLDPSVNKARRFRTHSINRHRGIIESHVLEVPEAFPAAVFWLTFRDLKNNYAQKWAVRAGKIDQEIQDYCQRGILGGSLWNNWLDDVMTAASDLKGTFKTPLKPTMNVVPERENP